MNGKSLADAAASVRDLPVLFASGYTRDAIMHDGHVDEGVNYLAKPFSATELTGRVRQLLDRVVEPASAAV